MRGDLLEKRFSVFSFRVSVKINPQVVIFLGTGNLIVA